MDQHLTCNSGRFLGTGAWVVWLIYSAVREYLLTRSQAAAQDKILSRVWARRRVCASRRFLASELGREFLYFDSNPIRTRAWRGIIRSAFRRRFKPSRYSALAYLLCHFLYRDYPGPTGFQPRRIQSWLRRLEPRRRYHWYFIFTQACCRRKRGIEPRTWTSRPSVRFMTRDGSETAISRYIVRVCVASRMWRMTCCRSGYFSAAS